MLVRNILSSHGTVYDGSGGVHRERQMATFVVGSSLMDAQTLQEERVPGVQEVNCKAGLQDIGAARRDLYPLSQVN